MIYGIGTDIVDLPRITRLHALYGEQFVQRVLSEIEQQNLSGSLITPRLLAKRFAAKEAFAKAVGTGLRAPVLLGNISVLHDGMGKPEFVCAPELAQWLAQKHIARVHLSISDEKQQILAFALAEQSPSLSGSLNEETPCKKSL